MTLDATYERVCPAAEIAKGTLAAFDVNGTQIAVAHCDDGSYHAVYDECSHQQIELSQGELDGCTVECMLHTSRFDLRTGEPTGPPGGRADPRLPR